MKKVKTMKKETMKRVNWFLWAMLLTILPPLQSCDDNDGYSIGDIGRDWATVRVLSGDTYYLVGDNWGKLWPAATAHWNYKPLDGQRVIAYFNPLSDRTGEYDHDVKVERLYNILTKEVEELTAENEASFGNDPVVIWQNDMWVDGGYLNVVFQQNVPNKERHRVSLVRNTTVADPNDGYIHLEYRYNTYNDLSGYWLEGAVSFNLNSLEMGENTKGIKVKLNSQKNGEVELTFDLNSTQTPASVKSMKLSGALSDKLK